MPGWEAVGTTSSFVSRHLPLRHARDGLRQESRVLQKLLQCYWMKIVDPFAWSKLTLTDRKSQENPRRGSMCDIAFKIFHVSFWMRKRLPVSWGETTKKTSKQFRTCHWGQMGDLSVVLKFGIAYSKAHPLISEQGELKLSLMEICRRQKWRDVPCSRCMKGPESFGRRASICSFQGRHALQQQWAQT